jgi:hypothetical protein
MKAERKGEVHQMLESYQQTDNSNLDSEKTAVIQEGGYLLDSGCRFKPLPVVV